MDQIFSPNDPIIRQAEYRDLPALEWDGELIHFRRLYREIYQSSIKGNSILWLAETSSSGVVGQIFAQLGVVSCRDDVGNRLAGIKIDGCTACAQDYLCRQ